MVADINDVRAMGPYGALALDSWYSLRQTLQEILTELQLADTRHDLQAKIVLALGSSGHPTGNP